MTKNCVDDLNQNNLHASRFMLNIAKAPKITYFCQSIILPGVSLGEALTPNPLLQWSVPGVHLTYDPLIITFPVNEDMSNYKELHSWLNECAAVESFAEREPTGELRNLLSDATLMIQGNDKKVIANVVMKDIFPTNVSDLQFDVSLGDVQILATATFKISHYTFDK